MKRYGNFFDRLVSFENLLVAAKKAFRGKKDRQAVASFYFGLENEIIDLKNELITGNYAPRKFRIFEVREPKVRKICSSDFRDRVVHHAICNLLEPVFERRLIYDTYACRTGKGCHAALRRCQQFTKRDGYFLKCDITPDGRLQRHDLVTVASRKIRSLYRKRAIKIFKVIHP